MAKVLGIAMRRRRRGEMIPLQHASVTLERGVEDDFRGRAGKRQVTILTREGWQAACGEIGADYPWQTRRANVYIEGLDLEQSQGKIVQIGLLQLLITKETDPCERMDEAHPGLFAALARHWRGGVCCQVLRGGEINVGDEVKLIHEEP